MTTTTTTNQDKTRGFLPPPGNHPDHDHNKSPITSSISNDVVSCTTTQDSEQQHQQVVVAAASLSHAIFKLREAFATIPKSGNYQSDMITNYQEKTSTGKRNPIDHMTTLLSDDDSGISTGGPLIDDYQQQRTKKKKKTTSSKKPPLTGVKTVCNLDPSHQEMSPRIKRMKKMEEMVKEMENKCLEFKTECESQLTTTTKDSTLNINSSQEIVEQGDVKEESVRFKRQNDGSTSIRLSCSCGKSFEMLHNHSGSFYRLM
uniref:uncharacterized protein LOC122597784 n=1 Tax=Erigeron canadensis TaxID=72917 RepID=UPI001CB90698|nr:uncharacterized protein LOC122597784 [Erigeron canadensis]